DIEGTVRDASSPYFGAYEFANNVNLPDASVEDITPVQTCIGTVPIQVQLKNYSALALQSSTINWSVNNVTQTPVNWNGNLSFNAKTVVNLGTLNYTEIGTYNLKVWVSAPNNGTDSFNANDTTSITSFSSLKGTYTVGGASPSFNTINDAVKALKKGGVCGAVTLNIRPGFYKESILVSDIDGLGSANTLTITSEDHNAASVKLQGSANNVAIEVRRIKNVIVRDLTFYDAGNYNSQFVIGDSTDNIELNGCTTRYIICNGPVSYVKNIRILNNTFDNSAYQRIEFLNYEPTNHYKNIEIKNNIIKGSNFVNIRLMGIDSLVYANNKVSDYAQTIPSLQIEKASFVTISKNDFQQVDLSAMTNVILSNNMMTYLNLMGCEFTAVNNSINSVAGTGNAAVVIDHCNNSNRFWNNIVVNKGKGYLINYISLPTTDFRNNAYYFAGNTFGYDIPTLQDWKQKTADTTFLITDPLFKSANDLHVSEVSLKNAGHDVSTFITTDYDGDTRDQTPDIGADEFIPTVIDASTNGFASFGPVVCLGTNPIQVTIRNNGTATLTSLDLPYVVNLDSAVYHWTGNLAPAKEIVVTLGNYNFKSHSLYKLKAWSVKPNNATDVITANDTSSIFFYAAMKGVYTIGGTSPNFNSFLEAANTIQTAGVCGPVVFNVRNGSYDEYFSLSTIKGNSAVNTITFQSENQDSSLVTLISRNSSPWNSTVINLDSVSYITFSKLTFQIEKDSYIEMFHLSRTHHCTIKNCSFITRPYSYSDTHFIRSVISSDSLAVTNCEFHNGQTAIELKGTYAQIVRNNFDTQYKNMIVGSGTDVFCASNTFNCTKEYGGSAILFSGLTSGILSKNKFILSGKDFKGIAFINANIDGLLIANNFMVLTGGSGIYLNNSNRIQILYNSILQKGDGVCFASDQTSQTVSKNNIYCNAFSKNYAVSLKNSIGYTSDHNCIYSAKDSLIIQDGVKFSSLNTYTTQTTNDSSSISVDPKYKSTTDLHATDISVSNGGVFNSAVKDDIDNEIRNVLHPSIGADEFSTDSIDAALSGFVSFDSTCIKGNKPVTIILKNNGTSNLTSAKIHWKINDTIQPIYNWTGNLASQNTALITLGVRDFKIASPYNMVVWASDPNNTADPAPLNDSTSLQFRVSIPAGTYTIGGISPTYTTIKEAANALNIYGICGPVIFKIRSGVYDGYVSLKDCKGASASNRITFESESADNTSVELKTIADSSDYIVKLNGADYITFKDVTFRNTVSVFKPCIVIANDASYNEIKNCRFISEPSTAGYCQLVVEDGMLKGNNYNQIIHNQFINGSTGICITHSEGNVIDNNTFNSNMGIFASYGPVGLKITNNKITANAAAISIDNPVDSIIISGNECVTKNGDGTFRLSNSPFNWDPTCVYPIYVRIYNNYFKNEKSSATAVVNFSTEKNIVVNFIHNTVRSEESDTRGIVIENSGGVYNFYNNIVAIKYKPVLSYSTIGLYTYFQSNANDYYTTSDVLISDGRRQYADLAAFRQATFQDSLSISIRPNFSNATSYRLNNPDLNNRGIPIDWIQKDIENKTRSTVKPDIGCYEFEPIVDSVWPGDANNDLIASNLDLLNIGLYYGETGNARAAVSNNWQAFPSLNWNKMQNNGADMKHTDCNGDGSINADDTLAIHQNFSAVHSFTTPTEEFVVAPPTLQFKTDKSTYAPGDWITMDIIAGSSQILVENFYGIAFNVNYSSGLVEPGTEVLTFNESWLLNSNTNPLTFGKIQPGSNMIFAAESRNDHSNKNGYGTIAKLKFQAKKALLSNAIMNFSLTGYVGNDALGNNLIFATAPYQINIVPVISGIHANEIANTLTAYPNPYTSSTTIFYTLSEKSDVQLEIFNSIGERIHVVNEIQQGGEYKYAFSAEEKGLSKGVYFVKLTVNKITTILKIVEL
ncbi:MAG TPA: NosD domain-containing protein, partial [Bacteroidia bacterium]|nr:NosD domain-containing protein [Bacteroidia bacterium]